MNIKELENNINGLLAKGKFKKAIAVFKKELDCLQKQQLIKTKMGTEAFETRASKENPNASQVNAETVEDANARQVNAETVEDANARQVNAETVEKANESKVSAETVNRLWDLGLALHIAISQAKDFNVEIYNELFKIINSILQIYILIGQTKSAEEGYSILSTWYEGIADEMAEKGFDFKEIKEFYEGAIHSLVISDQLDTHKVSKKFEIQLSILSVLLQGEKQALQKGEVEKARKIAELMNEYYCQKFDPQYANMLKAIKKGERNAYFDPQIAVNNAEAMSYVFDAYNILIPHFENNLLIPAKAKYFADQIQWVRYEIECQVDKRRPTRESLNDVDSFNQGPLTFHLKYLTVKYNCTFAPYSEDECEFQESFYSETSMNDSQDQAGKLALTRLPENGSDYGKVKRNRRNAGRPRRYSSL